MKTMRCHFNHALVLVGALALLWLSSATATTHYVAPSGGNVYPYTNWTTAATSIHAALNSAVAGETVLVTNGTYVLATQLVLSNAITLQSVNGRDGTCINGNHVTRGLYLKHDNCRVEGFTISNCYASGSGGAVLCHAGVLNNCAIVNNTALPSGLFWSSGGGGVWVVSNGVLLNCVIRNNAVQGEYCGGGVGLLYGGSLSNCVVEGNYAAVEGGGVYCLDYYARNSLIQDSTIAYNTCISGGGGVFLQRGTVSNCVINGNTGQHGGGGVLVDGQGVVTRCSINGNIAQWDGGGVYISRNGANTNVVIAWCEIANNRVTSQSGRGGGVFCYGAGMLSNCRITNNRSENAAGIYYQFDGGEIRNCLVADNTADAYNGIGGGLYCAAKNSRIESCTISGNAAPTAAGFYGATNCAVRNTILSANAGANYVNAASGIAYSYCCLTPSVAGTDNLTNNPAFLNSAAGDWRLATNSPCIKAGTNLPWMAGAQDLDGNARIINARVDIGCYEFGPFICSFAANVWHGMAPLTVAFSGAVSGSNTADAIWCWDFEGDGTTDLAGASLSAPSWTYTNTGAYAVLLVVSNASGESATARAREPISVYFTNVHYVALNGGNCAPYDTWATAARTPQAAMAAAFDGDTVFMSNGTYVLTEQISIDKAVAFIGVGGKDATVINGNAVCRGIYVDHAAAVLDGLTITNCRVATVMPELTGGGVFCDGDGVVRNCTIVQCTVLDTPGTGAGGGITLAGSAILSNCTVRQNYAGNSGGGVTARDRSRIVDSDIAMNKCFAWGGCGIDASGQTVIERCTVQGNSGANVGGGIFAADKTVVRACTVYNNAVDQSGGGGIYLYQGGLADACVVSNNLSNANGGGIYIKQTGIISNCVIVNNTAYHGGGLYCDGITATLVPKMYDSIVCGNSAGGYGGGIFFFVYGLAERCVIYSNSATYGGGSAFVHGGNARNCLLYDNHAAGTGGGANMEGSGGVLESATVCNNSAGDNYGGVRFYNGGALSNAIVYFNTGDNIGNSNGVVAYSCTPDVQRGAGNVTNAPLFVDGVARDYRLTAASFCVNAGRNQAWMNGATDCSGTNRILYGTVDMGAYEMPLDLWCSFTASVTQVMVGDPLQFWAMAAGSNALGIVYRWDFDNDGTIDTQSVANMINYSYDTEGIYSVYLSASNALGTVVARVRGDYIAVVPEPAGVAVVALGILTLWRHMKRKPIRGGVQRCAAWGLLAILCCGAAHAGTTNILFFGNSHTVCYPAYGNTPTGLAVIVRKIAVAAGQPAPNVFAQASSGKDLAWHINTCTNAGTNGIIYTALPTGQVWHFVVLQENTTRMRTALAASRADALTLANLVRAHSTNVQVVHRQNIAFHTNCSYYAAAPNWYPDKFADPAGMHEYYRTNVANTVAYLNGVLGAARARVAPDGDGFKNALWLDTLYRPNDFAHGNNRGWLICGMTVYKTMYGGTITNIPVANVSGLLSDLSLTSADWQEMALYVEPIPEPAAGAGALAGAAAIAGWRRGKREGQ